MFKYSISRLGLGVLVLSGLLASITVQSSPTSAPKSDEQVSNHEVLTPEHKEWLYQRFNDQHQALVPVVAVADMYYGCNAANEGESLLVADIMVKYDKNALAEQLVACLDGESISSEVALNYGIVGCFSQQLAHLSVEDKKEKMALVSASLILLSENERKKSFAKCVTEQAIYYLK